MRGLVRKTILATAIAGSSIFLAVGAQAHDDDHWRDEHWRREHRQYVEEHEHWRHDPPRRVVYERPVYERQPIIVAPAPVMMAPAPVYAPPVEPSLNFNFTVPLH
jgi:hypothetical protein